MPLRLQNKIISFISSTTAEERDIGNLEPRTYEISDALNEGSTRKYRVADGVANQTIDLAGLASAQYVLIKANRQITVRLNATDSIPLGIIEGFSYGYLLLTAPDGGITAMDVSNASGGTAQVLVQLVGEAA
jgi:hypothetical protein